MNKLNTVRHTAMWGMFIGDAMAMPVHWYYSPMDIKKDYGSWLTGYVAPKDKHPTSIMHLSAVDGSGRTSGEKSKQVIGNVILHDKLKYWTGHNKVHYHVGLKAGENTLNATTAFNTLQILKKTDPDGSMDPREARKIVLENYVKFMTTPGSHNDAYAESAHRLFFKDWLEHGEPRDGEGIVKFCEHRYQKITPATEDHQIGCIGAFVFALPWILHYADKPVDECAKNTVEAMKLTHPAPSLMDFVDLYARLLHAVLHGGDLKTEVLKIASDPVLGTPSKSKVIQKFSSEAQKYKQGSEEKLRLYQEAISVIGMACYIQGAMSSMLFLAHEFADDIRDGATTNANCGGENTHRGGALTALLAVHAVNTGQGIPDDLIQGLVNNQTYSNLLQ